MADKSTFSMALLATFEVLGKPAPSPAALVVWFSAIESAGLTWDQAQWALAEHIKTPGSGKFAPTPADLIERLKGTAKDQRAELEAQAVAEWGRVLQTVGRIGTYRSVIFDDWRTMNAIVACGGWQVLGEANQDDLNVLQAQFRRAYVGAQKANTPAVIGGRHGKEGGAKAVMIGDAEKCQRILADGKRGEVYQLTEPNPKQLSAPQALAKILELKR